MKTFVKALIAVAAILPVSLMADSSLSGREVKLIGDSTAKLVCGSVIDDDAQRLQQTLKVYRRTILYGNRFALNSHAVAGSFTCNKLALLPFAEEIGSSNVSNFLRGGVVIMEELVSSTN